MDIAGKRRVVYLGFNSFKIHKRGIENVIDFQSRASLSSFNYYVHWDKRTTIYSYGNLICIGIKNDIFRFITLNFILYRIKKRDKNLFIHSHNGLMSVLSVFQSNLFTVHDGLYYSMKAARHRFNKIFYLLEKILYMRTKYVHFISNYTKRMSLFSDDKKWIIISNTSHLEFIKDEKKCLNRDNSLKCFSAAATKIFIVRSIEERARIDLIIEAAKCLKDENYEFIVAGKGPMLDFYRNQISKLNLKNIRLLGYVSDDDLIGYYQDTDIVMVPSEYAEGFGLPIIEGYLFNKAVIASNRCAIPDIICSKDFLFENTAASAVDRIYFAKGKLKGDYKAYYDHNYSNAVIIQQFEQLYKSVF